MLVARSASEVLDEIRRLKNLGSDSALGEMFEVRQPTVASWRSRNSLPYDEIINFCIREGISTDNLLLTEKTITIEKTETDSFLRPHTITIEIDDLFTTRIKRRLGERSNKWLAGESGIDVARMEDIAAGREIPTYDELESIAGALRISARWLAERSPSASENWTYEFYKKDAESAFPAGIFKIYFVAAESFIEKMQGLIKLTPELKADVITTACRIHMKETPYSQEVNTELLHYLLMLPR